LTFLVFTARRSFTERGNVLIFVCTLH